MKQKNKSNNDKKIEKKKQSVIKNFDANEKLKFLKFFLIKKNQFENIIYYLNLTIIILLCFASIFFNAKTGYDYGGVSFYENNILLNLAIFLSVVSLLVFVFIFSLHLYYFIVAIKQKKHWYDNDYIHYGFDIITIISTLIIGIVNYKLIYIIEIFLIGFFVYYSYIKFEWNKKLTLKNIKKIKIKKSIKK